MLWLTVIDDLRVEIMLTLPDLVPCDFYLFPEVKRKLREQIFASVDDFNNSVMDVLNLLYNNGFKTVFRKWI